MSKRDDRYDLIEPMIAKGKRQMPSGLPAPAHKRDCPRRKRHADDKPESCTELGRARDQGIASAAFVIGGPDGLEPAFSASASLTLSFGAKT